MPRIRTFIAVDPGKAIRDRIVSLQDTLARAGTDVNWVEPDNLHVTLLFLGEVDNREVINVCRVVQECAKLHPAFALKVESVGCFPDARRPRIVWVGIGEGAPSLCALHDERETPLQELGYRREARRYTPHITMGRVKGDGAVGDLASALAKRANWKAGSTTIQEILVMGSELTPSGPVYTVLSRAKLGGDDRPRVAPLLGVE